jgi:hypothetical protein
MRRTTKLAPGSAMTAKGQIIDFMEVRRKAKMPRKAPEVHATTRMKPPPKEIRAVGNVPSMVGIAKPQMPPEWNQPTPVLRSGQATRTITTDKSMIDYTQVKVDDVKHIVTRPAGQPQVTANEVLDEITRGLRAPRQVQQTAARRQRRR